MSIQITVRAAGLNITANLKDESLVSIIKLVQDNRDDTAPQATTTPTLMGRLETSNDAPPALTGSFTGSNSEAAIKEWLKSHGAAELLNRFKWDSYPEKILLLGAWHESRGGNSPWRSADMDETFSQAKEKTPGNFPRDIRNAIKSGLIHAETPRTYMVTRTGWNKIGQAIEVLPQ